MISELIKYADNNKLFSAPGYTKKNVKNIIRYNDSGDFIGVLRVSDNEDPIVIPSAPYFTQSELLRNKGCHFLLESCLVAVLLDCDESDVKSKRKHNFFIDLLNQSGNIVNGMSSVVKSLQDKSTLSEIHNQLHSLGALPTENITIQIGDTIIVNSSDWHNWWDGVRAKLKDKSVTTKRLVSFADGTLVEPALTHEKIRGVSDTSAFGASFISFDKDSFQSYGLSQSENAAMSVESVSKYKASIEHLLDQGVKLLNSHVLFWYDDKVSESNDILSLLLASNSADEPDLALEEMHKMLSYIKTGIAPDYRTIMNAKYHVLIINGCIGRISVRDYAQGNLQDLMQSAIKWFQDLYIDHMYDTSVNFFKLESVMVCGLPARSKKTSYSDWVAPIKWATLSIWECAINPNAKLPVALISKIVTENTNMIISGEINFNLWQMRIGVLKAYLIRNQGDTHMIEYADKEHPSPAYHCGRLFYTLAYLQSFSTDANENGDKKTLNAGIVSKYYGGASRNPALVFGSLMDLHQSHLERLRSERMKDFFKNEISSIAACIKDEFPSNLSLSQQSLFSLGFYHQMYSDRKARREYFENKNSTAITDDNTSKEDATNE